MERVGDGDNFLVQTLAHQADLNPVLPAQIFAVAAQEIAGFLHGLANFQRVHCQRQRDGNDGRRGWGAITNQIQTHFRQTQAQPGGQFRRLGKTSFPIHAFHRGVQRVQQIR